MCGSVRRFERGNAVLFFRTFEPKTAVDRHQVETLIALAIKRSFGLIGLPTSADLLQCSLQRRQGLLEVDSSFVNQIW